MQRKRLLTLMIIVLLSLPGGFLGCDNRKGPAEKVGEGMDDAARDVKHSAENAGDEIEDAVD